MHQMSHQTPTPGPINPRWWALRSLLLARAARIRIEALLPSPTAGPLGRVPAGSGLQDSDITESGGVQASFVPDVEGAFTVNLQVSDGLAEGIDQVEIHVAASNVPPNAPPNAQAGADQTLALGPEVLVDGTGSHDPDASPDPLTFKWHFVFVPETSSLNDANLLEAETAIARFTPDVEGIYVLRVEVSDGSHTAGDSVLVTVGLPALQLTGQLTSVPDVPVEGDQVTLPYQVTNGGSGSDDPILLAIEIVDLSTGTILERLENPVVLLQDQPYEATQAISTNLAIGEYLLILRGELDGDKQTIVSHRLMVMAQPDQDGDGIPDAEDTCILSDTSPLLVIDGCHTGVTNHLLASGCTLSDEIAQCAEGVKNHGKFVSCVAKLTQTWKQEKIITSKEKGQIQRCAAKADIPPKKKK